MCMYIYIYIYYLSFSSAEAGAVTAAFLWNYIACSMLNISLS